jgi:hypothetical protein
MTWNSEAEAHTYGSLSPAIQLLAPTELLMRRNQHTPFSANDRRIALLCVGAQGVHAPAYWSVVESSGG